MQDILLQKIQFCPNTNKTNKLQPTNKISMLKAVQNQVKD